MASPVRHAGAVAGLKSTAEKSMKHPSITFLMLAFAGLAPSLQAQDPSTKVREIEQKVLLKQHQDAVHALAGSTTEGVSLAVIGRQLQWLTLVNNRIEGDGEMTVASREEMVRSAHTLNELAWRMIAPQEAGARNPEIALKLATIAIELGGTDKDLNPSLLDTRARSLFLLDRRDEAVVEQEKAVAAENDPAEKARLQNTLDAYGRNELPPVERPTAVAAKPPANPAKRENGTVYITEKLKRIVLPVVDFENASMEEVAEFLRKQVHLLDTSETDPSRRGVNFVVLRPPATTPEEQQLRVKNLHLRDVPVDVALRYICNITRCGYRVDEHAVSLVSPDMPPNIYHRTFRVPPDFISKLAPGLAAAPASGDPFVSNLAAAPASGNPAARPLIMDAFRAVGVVFPNGSSANLNASGVLVIGNTPEELDKVERLISAIPQEHHENDQPMEDTPPAVPGHDPSSGVHQILEKMRKMVIPSVSFKDVSLDDAVDFLRKQSIDLDTPESDPARKGITFFVRKPNAGDASDKDAPAAPVTDMPRIKDLQMENVPLAVALKYLCDATLCRFRVEDSGIIISPLDMPEDPFTRIFRVPENFASMLDSGSAAGEDDTETRPPLKELLRASGIEFDEGSSVAMGEPGILLVTNTREELEKIQQLIDAVSQAGK